MREVQVSDLDKVEDSVKVSFENFVGVFENAVSEEFCDKILQYYNDMDEAGFSKDRQKWQNTPKTKKEDDALCSSFEDEVCLRSTRDLYSLFNQRLGHLYSKYADEYDVLHTASDAHRSHATKIQKTRVGGGYHVWHYESSARETSHRVSTYILYLNDVEDGGETEFLYLSKRFKPKKGTMIIFPAAFTHTHRGNPPLSNEKYIMTGWIEF